MSKWTVLMIDVRPWLVALLFAAPVAAQSPAGPERLPAVDVEATGINYASAAVTHRGGQLESFFRRSGGGSVNIYSVQSDDHGYTWSEPRVLVSLPVAPWGGPMPLLDRDGELHFVIPRVRGEGRQPAVDRFIDLYHLRSFEQRTRWSQPERIFEGYCGAIQCLVQLRSGRIIAPFADWLPNVPTAPPSGPSVTTAVYSDDGGLTWLRSPAALTAPCHDGYNGANYGACEPTLLELNDGRVWMVIRTQTGLLYQSFSEDGVQWTPAVASRFPSSNSPAYPIRTSDGRIVLFWNNCEMPPRVDGQGVYGGRDALHAAVSDDEGQTWHGFREVYRDPTRNHSPPKRGDRGTAYPHATLTADGRILLVSGQGAQLRRRLLIDPDWLLDRTATDDCSSLDAWHVFKGCGPAERWWRDRKAGARVVDHPDQSGQSVLVLRRSDTLPPDGAAWNFPAGRSGRLTMRVQLEPDFGGARISLSDRFYDPCDEQGEARAPFSISIDSSGRVGDALQLQVGRWHTLTLTWTSQGALAVSLDDADLVSMPAEPPGVNGVSYLRLRSTAATVDQGGLLLDTVSAARN